MLSNSTSKTSTELGGMSLGPRLILGRGGVRLQPAVGRYSFCAQTRTSLIINVRQKLSKLFYNRSDSARSKPHLFEKEFGVLSRYANKSKVQGAGLEGLLLPYARAAGISSVRRSPGFIASSASSHLQPAAAQCGTDPTTPARALAGCYACQRTEASRRRRFTQLPGNC